MSLPAACKLVSAIITAASARRCEILLSELST
ncbi:MAG: hypothetical protein ACI8UP_004959, partial [Porticoccaceae bacterium]